jgi:hypothetical protein
MKFILQILDNGKVIEEKKYKSMTQIHKEYSQYDYHQLKQIYYQSKEKPRKLQSHNAKLYERLRIIDNFIEPCVSKEKLEANKL